MNYNFDLFFRYLVEIETHHKRILSYIVEHNVCDLLNRPNRTVNIFNFFIFFLFKIF